MTETAPGYVQAWQCIGCGRIEAPQPCIGVCRDRKVLLVGRDEHDAALAEIARLQNALAAAASRLSRFGSATPREGQWEASYRALQVQVREVLACLSPDAPGPD